MILRPNVTLTRVAQIFFDNKLIEYMQMSLNGFNLAFQNLASQSNVDATQNLRDLELAKSEIEKLRQDLRDREDDIRQKKRDLEELSFGKFKSFKR